MKNLKQQHEEFIARVKASGAPTLTFSCPCCGEPIEDRAAPKVETRDSLYSCPHCEGLFMKITTSEQIVGKLPRSEVKS